MSPSIAVTSYDTLGVSVLANIVEIRQVVVIEVTAIGIDTCTSFENAWKNSHTEIKASSPIKFSTNLPLQHTKRHNLMHL